MPNCPYCETAVADDVNFCVACERQVKCLKCSRLLYRNKSICLYCGTRIARTATEGASNRYSFNEQYTETTGSRSIQLELTDDAIKQAAPLFTNSLPVNFNGGRPEIQRALKGISASVVTSGERPNGEGACEHSTPEVVTN